jgi:aldehyde dehydrogenase (NAD+)
LRIFARPNQSKIMNKDFLSKLGLAADNDGTSTGSQGHHNPNDHIESYSPVDGALIGRVSTTTREEYDQVIPTAEEAFKTWRTDARSASAEKSCVNMAKHFANIKTLWGVS